MDSRAILAAIPEEYRPLHAFTFGRKNCGEIKIAGIASAIKGAAHHQMILDSNDWVSSKFNGIWKSDGSVSLKHMHGIVFHDEYKSYMDYNLNGFAGDLVLGGSYLKKLNL